MTDQSNQSRLDIAKEYIRHARDASTPDSAMASLMVAQVQALVAVADSMEEIVHNTRSILDNQTKKTQVQYYHVPKEQS